MHKLAETLLARIRCDELLHAGNRVGVAVSGGIDSVALLRLLLELRRELGIVVSVVHFNHKLRAESDADETFVAGLAREHGLEFHCECGDVRDLAAKGHSGVEAASRELRYEFFGRLLGGNADEEVTKGLKLESLMQLDGTAQAVPFQDIFQDIPFQNIPLNKIATGHTLDDQAETVLMRMVRGTGMRGLGGIYPRIVVEHDDGDSYGEIIRPLLEIKRRELEQYLADIKQPWREDASNADFKFTRNRMRRLVMPLLQREFNPTVVESLSELAEIARGEEDYWENEISGWLGTVVQWSEPDWVRDGGKLSNAPPELIQIQPIGSKSDKTHFDDPEAVDDIEDQSKELGAALSNASVSRPWLLTEPLAVQRRVLKAIGEQAGIPLEFKHVAEILRFAGEEGASGKELSLPLGWKLLRQPEAIVFVAPDLRQLPETEGYEYSLPVPGCILVPELRAAIEALHLPSGSGPESIEAEYNPQQLLCADLLPERLTIRNWRAGDRYWPAHTKSPKKIKELLQERHMTQPGRRLWPIAVSDKEIVWMRGFPVPASLRAKPGQGAVIIREISWGESHSL